MRELKTLVRSVWILVAVVGCSGGGLRSPSVEPVSRILAGNPAVFPVSLPPGGYLLLSTTNIRRPLANTNRGWWHDAVMYQVFSPAFNAGRLPTARLKYLQKVGFDGVWSTPVFSSPSDHGYNTTDYRRIKASMGGMAAFAAYRKEAEKRGIRIILDLVLNHTGSGHPWFRDAEAGRNGKRSWYVWKKEIPDGWQRPWGGGRSSSVWHYSHAAQHYYYGAFWRGMPDLNYRNPAVTREAVSIARHWLRQGADGYRFDAARYLIEDGPHPLQADRPATLAWWRDFHRALPGSMYSVGEVWADDLKKVAAYHDRGRSLRQCFDFSFYGALINALQTGSPERMYAHIRALKRSGAPLHFFAPFLDNHDKVYRNYRLMDAVSGPGLKDPPLLRAAFAMLLTFTGTPYVYYGTEIGMNRGPGRGDRAKRSPMDWGEAEKQMGDEDSHLASLRRLIAVRRREPALRRGDLVPVGSAKGRLLVWLRPGPTRSVLVVINPSRRAVRDSIDLRGQGIVSGASFLLYPVGSGRKGKGGLFR